MIMTSQASESIFFPYSYSDTFADIEFVSMSRPAFLRSAFLDHRISRDNPNTRTLSVADLLQSYGTVSETARQNSIHFVFHTAFCCSTLFARFCEFSASVLVLKEPWLLTQMQWLRIGVDLPSRSYPSFLALTLSLLTRTYAAQDHVIIKASDICMPLGHDIVALYPKASYSVVYSDLATFMSQILKSTDRRQWIVNRARALKMSGRKYPHSDTLPYDESDIFTAAAFVWATYMLTIERLNRTIPASQLDIFKDTEVAEASDETLSRISSNVGLQMSSGDFRYQRDALKYHAKSNLEYRSSSRHAELDRLKRIYESEIELGVRWIQVNSPGLLPRTGI